MKYCKSYHNVYCYIISVNKITVRTRLYNVRNLVQQFKSERNTKGHISGVVFAVFTCESGSSAQITCHRYSSQQCSFMKSLRERNKVA